jgi:hypothetical protein
MLFFQPSTFLVFVYTRGWLFAPLIPPISTDSIWKKIIPSRRLDEFPRSDVCWVHLVYGWWNSIAGINRTTEIYKEFWGNGLIGVSWDRVKRQDQPNPSLDWFQVWILSQQNEEGLKGLDWPGLHRCLGFLARWCMPQKYSFIKSFWNKTKQKGPKNLKCM